MMKKYGTVPMKTKVKNKLIKILRGGGYELNNLDYADYSERRAA